MLGSITARSMKAMNRVPKSEKKAVETAVLSSAQLNELVEVLEKREHQACAAAVALMLWGGVRYNDLRKWRWADVLGWGLDTSQSGMPLGMSYRVVRWMKAVGYAGDPNAPIVPRGWNKRWPALKQQLGLRDAYVLKATHKLLVCSGWQFPR